MTFKNIFFIVLFFLLIPFLPLIKEQISHFYMLHFDPRTQVGVIPIKGVLYNAHEYTKQLQKFFKDESIKAILLKIECPGGASGTAQVIFNEINALKLEHPTKFIMTLVDDNVCASGAYYIACATDYIIAPGAALIGGIGVRFNSLLYFQLKDLLEAYNIKYKPIKAGTYKNMTDPLADRSPQETGLLQELLNDTYKQFTQDVAQHRRISLKNVAQWADGKLFTGVLAKEVGLIDEVGSFSAAVKVIKERTLIEGEINWVYPPRQTGLFRLFESGEESISEQWIQSVVSSVCKALESRYSSESIR